MLIAQITDPHVIEAGRLTFGHVDCAEALARAVAHVNAVAPHPDLTLVTGDLVNDGTPAQYDQARAILDGLAMPYRVIPGNHDGRDAMRAAFEGSGALPAEEGPFLHYAMALGPLRIVALDTVIPGATAGALCRDRLAWTAARLDEAAGQPTLIVMHHPPFRTGIAEMDAFGLERGAADLADLIEAHGDIQRVLCGHLHRPIQTLWAGTLCQTAPATGFQIALRLAPSVPFGWVAEPAAVALHLWDGDGLISHLSYIGDHGPVRRFGDGAVLSG